MRSSDKYNELLRKIILGGSRLKTRNGYAVQLTNQTLKLSLSEGRFPVKLLKKYFIIKE